MNGEVVNSEWTFEASCEIPEMMGFAEGGDPIRDYRDLEVWKAGMALAKMAYKETAEFPREELYGLVSQMRRASVSIPANIAECFGRETTGAFIQFLRVAQGSLKELETLAELSNELGFLAEGVTESFNTKCRQLGKMLRGLIRSLERRN